MTPSTRHPRSLAAFPRRILAAVALLVAGGMWWDGPVMVEPAEPGPAVELVVDPNRVPLAVLGALPGIGPARLRAIAAAREERPFSSAEDLDRRVKGIGPAIIAELRPNLRFEATRSPRP